jgi:hypothetical protein
MATMVIPSSSKREAATSRSGANGSSRRPRDEEEYEFSSEEADVDVYDGETVVLEDAFYVPAGAVFDGGMKRYERPEGSCNEQAEGTDADAVFNLLPGSTIRNVIIGKHQSEGIHALGDAWVENGTSWCLRWLAGSAMVN